MSHFGYEQWVKYVADEVDESTRQAYEQHLYACNDCLELYMQAVESHAQELPKLMDGFTDNVLKKVKEHKKSRQEEQKSQSIFKKSFFHYVIAAAMTLILMSSGLFGQLTQVASSFEEKAGNEQNQSLTEGLIDKTLSIIQVIERNKEAK